MEPTRERTRERTRIRWSAPCLSGGRAYSGCLADAAAYKDGYRRRLDDAGWTPGEQERFIDEVRTAYDHNRALLAQVPTTGEAST